MKCHQFYRLSNEIKRIKVPSRCRFHLKDHLSFYGDENLKEQKKSKQSTFHKVKID